MFAIDSVSLCPYTGLLGITGSKRGFKGPLCFGWDVSTFHFPLFCFSCITFSRPMSCRCESLKVPILPLYSHEHVGDRVLWVDISKTLTWQMWIVLEQSHWKKQIHPVGCRPNFFFYISTTVADFIVYCWSNVALDFWSAHKGQTVTFIAFRTTTQVPLSRQRAWGVTSNWRLLENVFCLWDLDLQKISKLLPAIKLTLSIINLISEM